jgi:hypothetical protein
LLPPTRSSSPTYSPLDWSGHLRSTADATEPVGVFFDMGCQQRNHIEKIRPRQIPQPLWRRQEHLWTYGRTNHGTLHTITFIFSPYHYWFVGGMYDTVYPGKIQFLLLLFWVNFRNYIFSEVDY